MISAPPTPSSLSHPSKMRGRKHSSRKHKVLEKGVSCLKCLTQVKTWKREWESRKKCKIFLGHLKMAKHTGMPAQINGGKKEKILHGLWKTKMPPVNQEVFEMPISGGCEIVWGRGMLALWLHFFLHVWFYPLWGKVSLARWILLGFGKALQTNWTLLLLPLKMLANLWQYSTEVSCFNPCSENCEAVIATPGLILQ